MEIEAMLSPCLEKLRRMLPAGACAAEARPSFDESLLLEPERGAIAAATKKRRAEFIGGRIAARHALFELGIAEAPIPVAADRAPNWPDGVVGSISHCAECCVAVVAKSRQFRGVGVDIESAAPLEAELWTTVCTERELAWLLGQPSAMRGGLVKRIFSIKESAYKWQYPKTKRFLDFAELEVTLAPDCFQVEIAGSREQVAGRSAEAEGRLLSVVVS